MNNMRGFKDSYKHCYEEMDSVKSETGYWFKCFVMLFFLPIVWPVCWVICKISKV